MRVFLDVGAHTGETLQEVVRPEYRFGRIVCFEPAPSCWPALEKIADERVRICRFGLWSWTCRKELYAPGTVVASLFDDMETVPPGAEAITIDLVRVSEWFSENLSRDDLIFVKLNCEGSECDIVEDLMDSGQLERIYNLMIDFDVRKSPTLRHRELRLRRRLARSGLDNHCFSDDVMRGPTHGERIRRWLHLVGAHKPLGADELRRRYAEARRRLARKRGVWARFEEWLRRSVYRRLPAPLRDVARTLWRAVFPVRT